MDVKSLFPSIDISEVSSEINERIYSSRMFSDSMKVTLKSGLQLIIHSNFFMFDGKIYEQKMGAPIGFPVSGFLAEFEIRPFEKIIFEGFDKLPIFWKRYVDGVFLIWGWGWILLLSLLVMLIN